MKIIKTNWINITGVFIVTFVYAIILNLNDVNVSGNILQSILAALILVCLYGIMFWILYIVLLVIFHLLFIAKNQNNLISKLLIEWFIISIPFVYWGIKYQKWILIAAIVTFLVTQLFRTKSIKKA